jgi:hypothetical protein
MLHAKRNVMIDPCLRPLPLLFALLAGCDLNRTGDECEGAIKHICSSGQVNCNSPEEPKVVEKLRQCDDQEMIRRYGFHLPICIQESATYPSILGALMRNDLSLCALECGAACESEQACHEFQFAQCGVKREDAGVPDAR